MRWLTLLPALAALAASYKPMTEAQFDALASQTRQQRHPATLTRAQAREDLAAAGAAVKEVWRQRWDGGVRPVDVSALERRFEARLDKPVLPLQEFEDVVGGFVAALGDAHAYVMAAGAELGRVSDPVTPVNWKRLSGDIGMLRIDRFPEPAQPFGDKFPGLIDRAFAELKDTQGLLLDLRNNAGGDPNQADRLFDHLVSTRVFLYDEVVRRSPAMERYLGKERLAAWQWTAGDTYSKPRTLVYEPEQAERYGGKILILVDHKTVSAGEYVASELLDNGLARVAGERTPGHSGSVVPAELPNSRLVVALPIQHVLRKNGKPLQGLGVLPQYHLDPRGPHVIEDAEDILERWIAAGK